MYKNTIEDINENKCIRLSGTLFLKSVYTAYGFHRDQVNVSLNNEVKKNLDKGKNPIKFCNFIKGCRMIEFM